MPVAAVEGADGHDGGSEGEVDLSRHQGLETEHDLRPDDDRVDPRPGLGPMGLTPGDRDLDPVSRGHDPARTPGERPRLIRENVKSEDRVDPRIVEHALLHHQRGAALFARGRSFLCGLKDELDAARELGLESSQNVGGSQEDGEMVVVAARVHHAGLLARPLRGDVRLEGEVDFLRDRKSVHVRSQRDHGTGESAAEQADDTGLRDAGLHLESQRAQFVGHDLPSADLAVPEFGMLVEVAAPGHDLREDPVGGRVDGGVNRGRVRGGKGGTLLSGAGAPRDRAVQRNEGRDERTTNQAPHEASSR